MNKPPSPWPVFWCAFAGAFVALWASGSFPPQWLVAGATVVVFLVLILSHIPDPKGTGEPSRRQRCAAAELFDGELFGADLADNDLLRFHYPVWVLERPNAGPKGVVRVNGPGGAKGTPLFSNKGLLEEFRQRHPPLSRYEVSSIGDAKAFDAFLASVEREGLTHVVVDRVRPGALFLPITDVRWAARLPAHAE